MRARHALDAVGDDLPGGQRILHALVTHRDAVADADGVEFDRSAAGGEYAVLDGAGDCLEVDVARYDLVERVDDTDDGFSELAVCQSRRFQKGAVRGAADPSLI